MRKDEKGWGRRLKIRKKVKKKERRGKTQRQRKGEGEKIRKGGGGDRRHKKHQDLNLEERS